MSAFLEGFIDLPSQEAFRNDDVPEEPFVWDLPYDGIGIGFAAEDDLPRGVLVWAYPTEDRAQQQLAFVTAWFEAESANVSPNSAIFITLEQIEVRGSEIVANVQFPGDRGPLQLNHLYRNFDGPFGLAG